MVFITEGQSAAGSIVSCRDVETQAIFVLKGKPLNVWDLKRDIVYKNDEMYNLMRALDIEDNLEGLRTLKSGTPPSPLWTSATAWPTPFAWRCALKELVCCG